MKVANHLTNHTQLF